MSDWHDLTKEEKEAAIKAGWNKGLSYSAIAREFGVTRNVMIGFAHRHIQDHRTLSVKTNPKSTKTRRADGVNRGRPGRRSTFPVAPASAMALPPPPRVEVGMLPTGTKPIDFMKAERKSPNHPGNCMWVISGHGERPIMCCGNPIGPHPKMGESSPVYCPTCNGRALNSPSKGFGGTGGKSAATGAWR